MSWLRHSEMFCENDLIAIENQYLLLEVRAVFARSKISVSNNIVTRLIIVGGLLVKFFLKFIFVHIPRRLSHSCY